MHSVDRAKFAKILKHIVVLKFNDKEKFSRLTSFIAFVGMFCNNEDMCGFRTVECVLMDHVVKCYEMFLSQGGIYLSPEDKDALYMSFYGVSLRDVGHDYKPPKRLFRGLSKKKGKRINKVVEKAVYSVKSNQEAEPNEGKKKSKKAKKAKNKQKPITTTFFYSDNEEWLQKIDIILGVNNQTSEANN